MECWADAARVELRPLRPKRFLRLRLNGAGDARASGLVGTARFTIASAPRKRNGRIRYRSPAQFVGGGPAI